MKDVVWDADLVRDLAQCEAGLSLMLDELAGVMVKPEDTHGDDDESIEQYADGSSWTTTHDEHGDTLWTIRHGGREVATFTRRPFVVA